jgi:hypothetical protein
VKLRQTCPAGIAFGKYPNLFWMGKAMKSPFESSHRSLIICLAIAFVVLSVLIIEAVIAAPTAKAATSATVQQSAPPMPPCMRRVTVTSKPCGAMIYIDGIQVGRTPMSFPMPTGRYTLSFLHPDISNMHNGSWCRMRHWKSTPISFR